MQTEVNAISSAMLRPEARATRCWNGTAPIQAREEGTVWSHIVYALQGEPTIERVAPRAAGRARRRPASVTSGNAQIEVLERLSDRSIVIHWQDATRCCYVDQLWTFARARWSGRCALSGAAIKRDDEVYKPRARGETPGNAGAMILASALATLSPRERRQGASNA